MSTVWIRGLEDVLVRADAIIMLTCSSGGLHAKCINGRSVRLADSERPGALQLALLDQIGCSGADERLAVVITPPAERDTATWLREYAQILLDRLTEHDGR